MIVTNATVSDLNHALKTVNGQFDGNLKFRAIDQIGPRRVRFTLTVNSSRGTGSRISFSPFLSQRRVKAACWHAHGHFFDNLFTVRPDAVVRAAGRKITSTQGNWEDRELGSSVYPTRYSEACDCDN